MAVSFLDVPEAGSLSQGNPSPKVEHPQKKTYGGHTGKGVAVQRSTNFHVTNGMMGQGK